MGGTVAYSRGTNTLQGDMQTALGTNVAISGRILRGREAHRLSAQHIPMFAGIDVTAAGDFTIDKDGYLVNGGGYYLKGSPSTR